MAQISLAEINLLHSRDQYLHIIFPGLRITKRLLASSVYGRTTSFGVGMSDDAIEPCEQTREAVIREF